MTASVEVDKTGASYYGEQTLHYLSTNGETAVVQLREYRSSEDNCPVLHVLLCPVHCHTSTYFTLHITTRSSVCTSGRWS